MPNPVFRRSFPIDVVSDVVCPWCYVGKRRLAAALTRVIDDHRDIDFVVNWHPFQLNPELPATGTERKRYIEAKFGGPEQAAGIYERVRAVGATVGIAFDFDAIARQPNTLDAHRLIAWAQQQGPADTLVEQLFRAYFLDGRYVGDREVLAAIAGEAGLGVEAARAMLASDEGVDTVQGMDRRVRELGVSGVPFFIFDSRLAVSGAKETDDLVGVIEEALAPPAGEP